MSLAHYAAANANANAPYLIGPGVSAPAGPKFPDLLGPGAPVRARAFQAPGTTFHRIFAYSAFAFVAVGLLIGTLGSIAIVLAIGWLGDFLVRRRMLAQLQGTCLEVGPNQLPEIYACVEAFAKRLGLKEIPHIYIVEGNTANAGAARIGSRRHVFLVDDIVWGALKAGDPNALSFIIAHELAHHALGHTSALHTYLAFSYRKLSRLDELSCDAVALQLVRDREAACNGLIMLMVGPQLVPYVNREELFAQAARVAADPATRPAERAHTHPFIARRLHELGRVKLASNVQG